MNSRSQETLLKVGQNDSNLTTLILRRETDKYGSFHSYRGGDYSLLGECIGRNTHLKTLKVQHRGALSVREQDFFDGLIRNSSINDLQLKSIDEVRRSILEVYKQKKNLTRLVYIDDSGIYDHNIIISDAVRSCCTNLREVSLHRCALRDNQLLPIVKAVRGHASLESLDLSHNQINDAGCDTIATLLRDQHCNLHTLNLNNNIISNKGVEVLFNSLVNNTKLRELNLLGDAISPVEDTISRLLCDTSNINKIHASNHTLGTLTLGWDPEQEIKFLLTMNDGTTNKKHVAMKKILHFQAIDMKPLYGWDSEEELTLKALPYVVAWFERASEAVAEVNGFELLTDCEDEDSDEERFGFAGQAVERGKSVETKKLSAIYQFARSMPLMFTHSSKVGDKKRKMEDNMDV